MSPTVIVVDDDVSVRRAVRRLLRSVDYEVECYSLAQEYLEHDPPTGPACLVLDVRMPGRSGLDLQEAIAGTKHELPIVFITGHGDIPMSVRAMKGGAVDFLTKPFHDEDLLASIRRSIGKDEKNRSLRARRDELDGRVRTLTPREREVFLHVVSGLMNKQIAAVLGISEKTVKVHRGRVMRKMGAESLAVLVRMAGVLGC